MSEAESDFRAPCAMCGKHRVVVADAKTWLLANTHETVAKQIGLWQREKNPFIDTKELFADGVDDSSADVMLPTCESCLNLVMEIDRLKARLKDHFKTLWNILKFKDLTVTDEDGCYTLEYEIVYDDRENRPKVKAVPVSPSKPTTKKRKTKKSTSKRALSPPAPDYDFASDGSAWGETAMENGHEGESSGTGRRAKKGNRLKQILASMLPSKKRKPFLSEYRPKSEPSPARKPAVKRKNGVVGADGPESKKTRVIEEEMTELVRSGKIRATAPRVLKRIKCSSSWLKPDCRFCETIFATHAALKDHCDYEHVKSPAYACHFCLAEFSGLSEFAGHVMYEELQRSCKGGFKCGICHEDCRFPGLLADHFARHKDGKEDHPPFVCNECGLSFTAYAEFIEHRRRPKPEHGRKTARRSEFKCRDCKIHCQSEEDFKEHYQREHNVSAPFGCARCGQMFSSLADLNVHFVTVEFERRHVCGRCGTRFTDLSLADGHRKKSHALERALTCGRCGFVGCTLEEFKKHVADHDSGTCPMCGEDFWTEGPSEVDQHLMAHHRDQLKLMCPVCDRKFNELPLFKWHYENAHFGEEAVFDCDACGSGFETRLDYAMHKCVLSGNGSNANVEKQRSGARLRLVDSLTEKTDSGGRMEDEGEILRTEAEAEEPSLIETIFGAMAEEVDEFVPEPPEALSPSGLGCLADAAASNHVERILSLVDVEAKFPEDSTAEAAPTSGVVLPDISNVDRQEPGPQLVTSVVTPKSPDHESSSADSAALAEEPENFIVSWSVMATSDHDGDLMVTEPDLSTLVPAESTPTTLVAAAATLQVGSSESAGNHEELEAVSKTNA